MAVRLPSMPSVGSLLSLYKVHALKQLSQNFLLQPKILENFVKAAGPLRNGLVCEVGPGPGGITRAILKQSPKHLLLIEKDKRFKPMLEALQEAAPLCGSKVEIAYADILDLNMAPFFDESYTKNWEDEPPNIHILGNLPFDVSTSLITRWLSDISHRRNAWKMGRVKMTLTFQKEVAERMVAPILATNRCRLSVICQNYCRISHKFTIRGASFVPKPDVDVGVVHLVPLVEPVISQPFHVIEKVLRTVFSCRRKYIKFGVRNLFPLSERLELTDEVFKKAELDPTMRAFQLSVEEWGRIVSVYSEICNRNPSIFKYDYRGYTGTREYSWQQDDDDDDDDDNVVAQDGRRWRAQSE